MKIEFTKEKLDILKQNLKLNSNYYSIANLTLDNKLFLHSNLEIIEFKDEIDWGYEHKTSPKTYQVYIHSLSFLNPLLYLYETTKELKYLKKVEKEIKRWLNYSEISDNGNIWAEQAVANRLITLMYFLFFINKTSINYNRLLHIIERHLNFLSNPIHYKENNHGLMMDRALLLTSIFLKNNNQKTFYLDVAKNRIEKLILRDFSYQGVHLENSPEYHILVLKLIKQVINLFKILEYKLDYRIIDILKKAENYLPHIVNHKQELPLIGDTALNYIKENKCYNDFIDYEAGICIFNNEDLKSTLIFNSGFKNKAHKHRDDLSFIYSINGHNLFTDGGKLSYDYESKLVKHIRSPLAHNAFTIRGLEYSILDNNLSKIITTFSTEDYKYVVGEMKFNEKILKRHLILFNEGHIIIVDQGKSVKEEEWIQNFLLDDAVQINKMEAKLLNIKHNDLEYHIDFLTMNSDIRVFFGKKNNAFISKKFNETTDCYRIENVKFGKDCSFLTTIFPKSSQSYEIKLENSSLIFIDSNKTITVPLQCSGFEDTIARE